jgi:predicted aminopeptidase
MQRLIGQKGVMTRLISILPCLACLLALNGCYYVQAVRGHMALMNDREPIAGLVENPAVDGDLKELLLTVQAARRFSVDHLALPDNDSYTDYVSTGRHYVVWNVFAAQEFSLSPELFCFPVAGCVAYQGYFSQQKAGKRAQKLASRGLDVAVGGVAAYSTLGRFADPVLDTMADRGVNDLVETMFHELAHQKLYVKGDTDFNESFATVVAQIGMEDWLRSRDDLAGLAAYRRQKLRDEDLHQLIENRRSQLDRLYTSAEEETLLKPAKQRQFRELRTELQQFFGEQGLPEWFAGDLNNATLLPFKLYGRWRGAFTDLFVQCGSDFRCFYAEAERLAAMPPERRAAALNAIASGAS